MAGLYRSPNYANAHCTHAQDAMGRHAQKGRAADGPEGFNSLTRPTFNNQFRFAKHQEKDKPSLIRTLPSNKIASTVDAHRSLQRRAMLTKDLVQADCGFFLGAERHGFEQGWRTP